ncbi:Multidrug resistance protein 1B, partial [Araneus ventricosus]
MFVGFIAALCAGAIFPTVQIVFGSFLNTFVQHATDNTTDPNKNPSYSGDDFLHEIGELCLYSAGLGVALLVINYIILSTFGLSAANQAYKIRCLFMASMLKQDIAYFDTKQTGDFASVMTGDLKKIEDGIGEKVGICTNLLSTCVISVIVGTLYGWKLALVSFSLTPVLTVAQALLSKVQASASREESEAYGAAGAVAEEALSSVRTVASFGGEQKEIQ